MSDAMKWSTLKPAAPTIIQMVVYALTIFGAIQYVGKRDAQLERAIDDLAETRTAVAAVVEDVNGLTTREAARDQRMATTDAQLLELKSIAQDLVKAHALSEKERLTAMHALDLRVTRIESRPP